MTSEGEGTKRTILGDAAIPMENLPKRVRFSSGKLLWARLVKEHIAEESRSAAVRQAKVFIKLPTSTSPQAHIAHFRQKTWQARISRAQSCCRCRSFVARATSITDCMTML
jgi:hypothetical protein